MANLQAIAKETMQRFGFLTEPSSAALAELARLNDEDFSKSGIQDLSNGLWSSIDNDDSRDLDQVEYIQSEPKGLRLFIGIADIASIVERGTALDQDARHNTTAVYTGVRTFPLFPPKLSAGLTSLLEWEKRRAVVIEMLISRQGELLESSIYRAIVQNHAQLTYEAVAAWLDQQPGSGSPITKKMIQKIHAQPALQEQLRLQRDLAQALRRRRAETGALTFETLELKPALLPSGEIELKTGTRNVATRLIEDFMIVANQATVAFLQSKGFPTLRRVVRTPKNWPRIVELASQEGVTLPGEPDVKALEDFLNTERKKDPDHFPDLSLAVIKLLGRGEYVLAAPGSEAPGHFALAIDGYSHTTAPNRRYPDVITQRLLLAAVSEKMLPYSLGELAELAQHCTQKEADANKAERSVHKSIAATVMASRVGEKFEGMITGASVKGVWARIFQPPVEGRVEGAPTGIAVGDRVWIKLVSTDPERGYIDFNFLSRR